MKKYLGVLMVGALMASVIPTFAQATTYTDIPEAHWAVPAVTTVSNAGLFIGYPDGTFGGDRPMTRYEVAQMMARLMLKMNMSPSATQDQIVAGLVKEIMNNPALAAKLTGPAGVAGERGMTGAQGPQGVAGVGVQGEHGVMGSMGLPGIQGLPGTKGDTGMQGPLGDKGDTGATGPEGKRGPQGDKGDPGNVGPAGTGNGNGNGTVGATGAKGDRGDTGATGAAGPAGAQLTKEEKAALAQITNMIKTVLPEIEVMRGNYALYDQRLAALEKVMGTGGVIVGGPGTGSMSQVQIGMDAHYRYGLMGTYLQMAPHDDAVVSTDNVILGSAGNNDPGMRKDAQRGTTSGVSIFDINLKSTMSNDSNITATLRAISPVYAQQMGVTNGVGSTYTKTTVTDSVELYKWAANFNTKVFGTKVNMNLGRDDVKHGMGLLVDTTGSPFTGLTAEVDAGSLTLGMNMYLINRLSSTGLQTHNNHYIAGYIGTNIGKLNITATGLISGLGSEKGGSISIDSPFLGNSRIFGEVAVNKDSKEIDKLGKDDGAFVAGIDVPLGIKALTATVSYGELGKNYNMTYSALNPFADVNGYDISWLDRPLFLSTTNIRKGWEGKLNYGFGENKDWKVGLRAYGQFNKNAGNVVSASIGKKLTKNVDASVIYGRRVNLDNNVAGLDGGTNLNVLMGQMDVRF